MGLCGIAYNMNYLECLPPYVQTVLCRFADVQEIRLRDGQAVRVNVSGQWRWLCNDGLTTDKSKAFIFEERCEEVVECACEGSIYVYENMLADGYFTLGDGARIGVCGRYVSANKVFGSFTSLCIRVPHNVKCLTAEMSDKLSHERCVVFVGPPSSGKTTCLRNFAEHLSRTQNVVVCDERRELSFDNCLDGCDVLSGADKQYALTVAVRSMSPDWVVCDELLPTEEKYVSACILSGVRLVCSVHGSSVGDMKNNFPLLSDCATTAVLLDRNHKIVVEKLR